jgi:diguanylate cyclase (GGDEF)-like protein
MLRSAQLAVPRVTSLRSVMWLGVVCSVALSVIAFGVVVARVVGVTNARHEMNLRMNAALSAHDLRVAALVAQREAPDLAAHERARARETALEIDMLSALDAHERDVVRNAARRLDETVAAWRGEARAGQFAEVIAASTRVRTALEEERKRAYTRFNHQLQIAVVCGVFLGVLAIVLAIVIVVWVLRRTATPLERLSRTAASGVAFPAVNADVGIREVDALARALHSLDVAVRDKEQRLAEAHAEAVDLMRFGEHVQQVVDEDELHDVLARRLTQVSRADSIRTLTWQGTDKQRLQIAHSTTGETKRLHLPILAEPMRCRAVRTLKPVMHDSDSPTACRCPLAPPGGSYICEPLLAAGELVGVVTLQADSPGRFNQRVERKTRAALGFGATALASLRLLAATRERALRDPLTGAYNRAFLAEYLPKQLAAAGRSGAGLGVLAVDLDHFKRLNDTYGHAIGDRALIAAVDAIQREVRSADAVVRHGGEELVVVLADTHLDGAREAAERIRAAIAQIDLPTDQGRAEVRASIGVSAYPDHGRDEAALLAAADRALYQAKESGRNRVVTAESRLAATFDVPVAIAN